MNEKLHREYGTGDTFSRTLEGMHNYRIALP